MENMDMKTNEIEEIEYTDESEESSDGIDVVPMVVAFVAGVATPYAIKGVKRLVTFARGKWAARKHSDADTETEEIMDIDAERIQTNSSDETVGK